VLHLLGAYLVSRDLVPPLQTEHPYSLSRKVEKKDLPPLQTTQTTEISHYETPRLYKWLQTVLGSSGRQCKQNKRCISISPSFTEQ